MDPTCFSQVTLGSEIRVEEPRHRPVGQNPPQPPNQLEAETGPSLDPDGADSPALSQDPSVTAVPTSRG